MLCSPTLTSSTGFLRPSREGAPETSPSPILSRQSSTSQVALHRTQPGGGRLRRTGWRHKKGVYSSYTPNSARGRLNPLELRRRRLGSHRIRSELLRLHNCSLARVTIQKVLAKYQQPLLKTSHRPRKAKYRYAREVPSGASAVRHVRDR